MKMPKLNHRLLNRIKKHIQDEPRRYNQGNWVADVHDEPDAPACGTRACIAGWAIFLSTPKSRWSRIFKFANELQTLGFEDFEDTYFFRKGRKLLGLTRSEAAALFGASNQSYLNGAAGVREGCQKIDSLKKDRAAFIENY